MRVSMNRGLKREWEAPPNAACCRSSIRRRGMVRNSSTRILTHYESAYPAVLTAIHTVGIDVPVAGNPIVARRSAPCGRTGGRPR